MVFYFVGVMVVDNLASPTEDEWRIAAEIREGQISGLLTKPLNHLAYRLSLFGAYRFLYSLVTLPVVGLVLWGLGEHLRFPAQAQTWCLFFLAVCGSALIQFFIAYSLAMLAFWILEVSTLIFILYSFEYFLSGHVFPLDLLSPKMQAALEWTPFPYELFFPVQVLLERMDPAAMQRGFAIQFLWVCLLGCIARTMWNCGVRKYQAVGG
jgi:ABC-2 type transport system permease protein